MFQNLKIHFKRKTIKFFTCRILLNWFHPHILLLKALELLRLMALISLQNLRKNHTNGSFLKTQLKRHTQPSGPTGERDLCAPELRKKKANFFGDLLHTAFYHDYLCIALYTPQILKVRQGKISVFFIFMLPQFLTWYLEHFIGSSVFYSGSLARDLSEISYITIF